MKKRDNIVLFLCEKMQGMERDLVVVCYGFADKVKLATELDFVYTRSRLNVALSRAKQKVVMIVADSLLHPDADVFASEARQSAFSLLEAVRAECQSVERNGCVYVEHACAGDGAAAPDGGARKRKLDEVAEDEQSGQSDMVVDR